MTRLVVLCGCFALWLTEARAEDRLFRLNDAFAQSIRAQSPDSGSLPPTFSDPSSTGAYNPFQPNTPQDPFLGSPPAPDYYQPGPPPVGFAPLYGTTGPQPYRMGWTPKLDLAYLPSAHTGPNVGHFSAWELDAELVFNAPFGPDLVFTAAPQFGFHQWDASKSFSRDLYRFGANLQIATPAANGPFGYQLTFNPSLNTDFESNLAGESVNLDANVMTYFRLDPTFMAVLGVGYLDRVDDIILPYAGIVYTPDDLWEFRLLFPQGRISRFIGNFWWGSHWLYLAWEYHVDAYQVSTPGNNRNQIQYEDYRLTFGMRSDHPGFTKYIEAGYVFGRNVDYKRTLPGFDVSDGFIVRGGIRF